MYDSDLLREKKASAFCVYRILGPVVLGLGVLMPILTFLYHVHIAHTVIGLLEELWERIAQSLAP